MRIERFLPRSEYAKSFDRVADRLVVIFSPAGAPAGQFSGIRGAGAGRHDILAFNSPDAQWYVGGIPETADQPGRFEQGLVEFIRTGRYRRVLFCGASKGAFAAVDFGLRCGATSILVTGLESLHGLCAMFRSVVPAPVAARQRRRLAEWPALARASKVPVLSFYGAESLTDLLYAWVAPRRLGAKALLLAKAGHFLPPVIQERVGLGALIEAALERNDLAGLEQSLADVDLARIGRSAVAFVQGTERHRYHAWFDPGIEPQTETEAYAAAAALVVQRRPRAALTLLERPHGAVIRDEPWDLLRARALLGAGDAEAAEPIARRLHDADPSALEPVQALHRALMGSGRRDEAAALAISRYRQDPGRLGLLESHLGHLIATGRKPDAASLLSAELQNPAHAKYLPTLRDLATRLDLPSPSGATP